MMILAPLGAMLVQMAISRTREYAADDLGARICGQPMWLASALAKIANAAHQVPNPEAERNPATAHMFIINPLSGHGMDNLFTTHPATENRIAALQQLAAQMGAQGGTPSVNARGNYPRRSPWGRPLGLARTVGVIRECARVSEVTGGVTTCAGIVRERSDDPACQQTAVLKSCQACGVLGSSRTSRG